MSYTKTNWQNTPSTQTPISAANLNHIEQGIYDAAQTADSAQSGVDGLDPRMDLVEQRLDNLIPQGTPTQGNAELIDIRVGANGVTYPTAGDAVRGQVTEIKSALTKIYAEGSKTITSESGHVYVENYPIVNGHSYTVTNLTDKACALRTSNNKTPDTVQSITDNLVSNGKITFTASADAKYLRAYFSASASGSIVIVDNGTLIADIKSDISTIETNISGLPLLQDNMDDLYVKRVVTPSSIGYVNLWGAVTVGDKLKVINNSGKTLVIVSRTSGSNVETFTDNLANGSSIVFTVSQNASNIATYNDYTAVTGSVTTIDQNKIVPKLQSDVDVLKSDVNKNTAKIANLITPIENDSSLWEAGGFNYSGIKNADADKVRTKDFIDDTIFSVLLADTSYKMYVFAWNDSNQCVGYWYGSYFNNDTSLSLRNVNNFAFDEFRRIYQGYKFKLVLHKTSISVSDVTNVIKFTHCVPKLGEYRQRPLLTFIDDDGYAESGTIWEDICKTCNIPVTMALVTGTVGTGGKMEWSKIERLNNIGFEFISHTHNHIYLGENTLTEQEIIADFEASIAALKEHGCQPNYLVYPYTTITTRNKGIVNDYFALGIGLDNVWNVAYIDNTNVKRLNVTSGTEEKEIDGQMVEVNSYRTLDSFKSYMDATIRDNGWLVVMTHLRNTAVSDGYYYDSDARDLMISYINYAKEKNVEIVTVAKAHEIFKSLIKNLDSI